MSEIFDVFDGLSRPQSYRTHAPLTRVNVTAYMCSFSQSQLASFLQHTDLDRADCPALHA